MQQSPLRVLTIGHSTRLLEEFLGLLQAHGVGCLVDVRTIPRSRHNPQFNQDTLSAALQAAGVAYRHMPGLGGLRQTRKDSPNTGWKNLSFRGYADYMQSGAFDRALQDLLDVAVRQVTAVLCAEALPWRCHRSLIADALAVRHVSVEHIFSRTARQVHRVTPWATIEGPRITYPETPESIESAHGER